MSNKKITHVCPVCGSDNLSVDAAARWDVESQKWTLSGVMDSGGCDNCQEEIKRTLEKEVDVPSTDPVVTVTAMFQELIRTAIASRVRVDLKTALDEFDKPEQYELRVSHKDTPKENQRQDTRVILMNVPRYEGDIYPPETEWEVWCDGQKIDTVMAMTEKGALRQAREKRPGLMMHLSVLPKLTT